MAKRYNFGGVKLSINAAGGQRDASCVSGGSYICPSSKSLDACTGDVTVRGGWSCVGESYYADRSETRSNASEKMQALAAELDALLSKHLG